MPPDELYQRAAEIAEERGDPDAAKLCRSRFRHEGHKKPSHMTVLRAARALQAAEDEWRDRRASPGEPEA